MILDECNVLEIKILSKSDVNISKSISPIKALFYKTYGKEISSTFEEINKMNLNELEQIISNGEYNGYKIEPGLFNYSYNVELSNDQDRIKDLLYKEFNFGVHKDKIIILMDKSWTESNDRIYYYRLVATSIQKSRKNAGLHPWDEIYASWEGQPKYTLESDEALEYIGNITRIKLSSYQAKLPKLIYSSDFDNIGIKIHLSK